MIETSKHKYWNKRKYMLDENRWRRTEVSHIYLSHDVWNFYNINDKIQKNDKTVIHHINRISSDDRIENLEKMSCGNHQSFHHIGNQYSKGKFKIRFLKYYQRLYVTNITIDKYKYQESVYITLKNRVKLNSILGSEEIL